MTVENWLLALHMVNDPVDYLPYRIFVVFVGLIITALSVTGVYIWWKKRKARIHAKSHAASGTALHTSTNAKTRQRQHTMRASRLAFILAKGD